MLQNTVFMLLLVTTVAEWPPGCGPVDKTLVAKADHWGERVGGVFAYAVQAEWVMRVDEDGKHICTGSLISRQHVVTAAHCVADRDTCSAVHKVFTVCPYKTDNSYGCPHPVNVKRILHRENYLASKCVTAYDFVVLELEKEIDLNPVCLPTEANGIFADHNYTLHDTYLFGYSGNKDVYSDKPPNNQLKFVKAGKPKDAGVNFLVLQTGHQYQGKTVAICGGDSGGPMVEIQDGNRAVLVGINIKSRWNCDSDTLELGKNWTEHYQYHIAVKPRLNDWDPYYGTKVFPEV